MVSNGLGNKSLETLLEKRKGYMNLQAKFRERKRPINANLVIVVGVVFAKWSSDNNIKGEKKMRRKKQQT